MSNWFTRIFSPSHPTPDGLTQTQREALLDLFNFCMCADGKLVVSEENFVSTEAKRFHWDSPESVADFSAASIERARAAHLSPSAREQYAVEINERLLTTELKSDAVGLCRQLFLVDGEYAAAEQAAFANIARTFGWPG
jgi:uncharacterized tellurite resistance protein B-like protein